MPEMHIAAAPCPASIEALKEILSHIQSVETSDILRSNCAVYLAQAGQFEQAIEMTKTVNDADDKNGVLKRIATLD